MTFTTILFALMFKYDRHWMPNPRLNYLSWSYGLALLSTFFSIFGSIAQVVYVKIVRQEFREAPPPSDNFGIPPPIGDLSRHSAPTAHQASVSYSGLKLFGSKGDLTSYSVA